MAYGVELNNGNQCMLNPGTSVNLLPQWKPTTPGWMTQPQMEPHLLQYAGARQGHVVFINCKCISFSQIIMSLFLNVPRSVRVWILLTTMAELSSLLVYHTHPEWTPRSSWRWNSWMNQGPAQARWDPSFLSEWMNFAPLKIFKWRTLLFRDSLVMSGTANRPQEQWTKLLDVLSDIKMTLELSCCVIRGNSFPCFPRFED